MDNINFSSIFSVESKIKSHKTSGQRHQAAFGAVVRAFRNVYDLFTYFVTVK